MRKYGIKDIMSIDVIDIATGEVILSFKDFNANEFPSVVEWIEELEPNKEQVEEKDSNKKEVM